MSTQTPTDLATLSDKELQAELARREKARKAEAEKAKKDYLKDKEDFLEATVSKFSHLSNELLHLKHQTISAANELFDRMYEVDGKEPKEVKTFTLKSDDDTLKVEVERQERFTFTDEAVVHIGAIQDIFKAKFADRNKGLYEILDALLIKNTKGEYDAKLLAKARQQVRKLGDVALIEEFDKLQDCQRVVGTSTYCRAYRKDAHGKWEDVKIQFSSL